MQDEGGKRGGTGTGTALDAGTQRGVQGLAAEVGEWQVMLTPRWAALCTGRGGGERVKQEGFDEKWLWMGRRQKRGGGEYPEKVWGKKWGGRAGL